MMVNALITFFISAASQDPSKKLGGRHGMVFGHVQQPGSSPVAAVIPGT